MAQYKVGDRVMVGGKEYRIVRDRIWKGDLPGFPGPFGGGGEIGVTMANKKDRDRLEWTIIHKTD